MSCQSFVVVAVITYIVAYILHIQLHSELAHKPYLIVGVLSSRDHFPHREILRKGIKNQYTKERILVKFIISKEPCFIPFNYRLNPYECERDEFVQTHLESIHTHEVKQNRRAITYATDGPIGIDFVVHHDVVIKELGLFDFKNDGFIGALKVILYNTVTHEPVIASSFVSFKSGRLHQSFRYKTVEEYMLPKGFRGSLVVEGATSDDPLLRGHTDCKITGKGMINFMKGYRYSDEIGEFPLHYNKHPKMECYLFSASLVFSSYGISANHNMTDWLSQQDKEYTDWRIRSQHEELSLKKEQEKYGDLLFVDVVESYRSLPKKMLLFHDWLSRLPGYEFVFKTDDDCYVNVTGIIETLLEISKHGKNNIWLGSFRKNFALDKHGKWAEYEYTSASYPPFACGSGYVLSRDIIEWISSNKDSLKIYQGEDTSLGIWLAAIGPTLLHDNRFQCFHGCKHGMLSSPENNLSELELLYKNVNMTTSLCDALI